MDNKTSENDGIKAIPEMRHPYRGKDTAFEDYLPFVKITEKKLKERFINVLKDVFAVTGDKWRPGWCYSTQGLEKAVKELKTNTQLSEVEFSPMNYFSAHYYLTAKFKDSDKNLIIDPFGVPPNPGKEVEYIRDPNLIIPFFGESELAPSSYHQRVYSIAKPLDERGYHQFHP